VCGAFSLSLSTRAPVGSRGATSSS
jgi:hypothetical protein